jgi:hypothetical protein
MAAADFDAGQMRRDQRHGNAKVFVRTDQMVGVVGLEGKAQQCRDRAERDVALVPVKAQPKHFTALKVALADDAAVDHRRGIGAGFRAGQSEAGNFATIGQPRQPLLLLIAGAKAHQQFARAERVRHHHGDSGRDRAGRDLAYHFRVRVGRKAEPAIFPGDDHAEEFFALDELPYFRRQIAPFPIDLPVVEHRAQLIDRTVEEGRFFRRQRHRRIGEQLGPLRIAGKKVGVPPDIAGLQRLALGIRHGRQHATGPREDRLGDVIAAKGEGAHGDVLMVGAAARRLRPAFAEQVAQSSRKA